MAELSETQPWHLAGSGGGGFRNAGVSPALRPRLSEADCPCVTIDGTV